MVTISVPNSFVHTLKVRIYSAIRRMMAHRMCVGGAQKADQVFLPVLENANKAQKLRTTLSVLDRSRFFFNLPGTLMEAIAAVSIYRCARS